MVVTGRVSLCTHCIPVAMEASPPLRFARAEKHRTLTEDVRAVFQQLRSLNLRLSDERPQSTCIPTVQHTMNSLMAEFDVASEKLRGRKRAAKDVASSSQEIVQLKRQVSYQTICREKSHLSLLEHLGHPVSGRICNVWLLRAALSPPNVPTRKLAEWCQDFNVDLARSVRKDTASQAKNALCELVKHWNRIQVSSTVAAAQAHRHPSESLRVYIPHEQDEACFKMESRQRVTTAHDAASSLRRAKSSKVLNHVIHIHVDDSFVKWIEELQPLSKKDAATIGSGLISVIKNVIQTCFRQVTLDNLVAKPRVLHAITGELWTELSQPSLSQPSLGQP